MKPGPSNGIGALLGLAAFGLYAGYDVSVKFLGGGYSPFQILFFAGLMAFPMMVAVAMLDGTARGLRPLAPRWMALRVGLTLINGILGTYAFATLPLAQCYAVFFSMPILIALLAVPLLGERIDRVRGVAVLVGLAGVLIALDPHGESLNLAHLAAILASILGAMNYVLIRKTGAVERPVVMMLYPALAQFIVAGAVLPLVYEPMPLRDLALTGLMAAAATAGSLLIIAAYTRAKAIVVASMQYSQILWAAIFGAILFNESISFEMAVGIALIIASGIVIAIRQDKSPAVSPQPPASQTTA